MRRLVLMGTAVCGFWVVAQAQTAWMGWAVTAQYQMIQVGPFGSEAAAQQEAKARCEGVSGRTCPLSLQVIAVPVDWDVGAVVCGGRPFIGGASARANEYDIALNKARLQGMDTSACRAIQPPYQ